MRYRSDIDGLRAFAILPVVLYHLSVRPFTGGFVGVDIFFVISGYLITGIIAGEIAQGRFTLLEFYERRVRRIFPALFTMLAATTAVAFALMPPGALLDEARSLLYTVLFLSNLYFAKADSYFDTPSELKPLLHTWSLAVEEQFYLLFPLLLMLLHRFARNRFRPFILGIGLLSFAMSVVAVARAPVAAFYATPFRAWELMLGAGLALGLVPPARPGPRAQALALLGLGLIAASILAIDAATPFPGLAALAPCLGAALLLHTGSVATLGTRLLSLRPLVFLGKISYSLYLWHWPVIVFFRTRPDHVLNGRDGLLMFALAFAAACLSWYFVERPLRGKSSVVGRKALFAGAGAFAVALVGVGVGLRASEGAGLRFEAYPQVKEALARDLEMRARLKLSPCADPGLMRLGIDGGTEAYCRHFGALEAPVRFVLWGDSHANAWLPGFVAAAERLGLHGIVISVSGCPSLAGVVRTDPGAALSHCTDPGQGAAILRYIESQHPQDVFLADRWSLYSHGWITHGRLAGPTHFLTEEPGVPATLQTSRAALAEALPRTVSALAAFTRVTLIKTVPVLGLEAPDIALLPAGERARYLPSPAGHEDFERFAGTLIAHLARDRRVQVFDPARRLCAETCAPMREGHLLYADDNHLSADGALLFEGDIEALLNATVVGAL